MTVSLRISKSAQAKAHNYLTLYGEWKERPINALGYPNRTSYYVPENSGLSAKKWVKKYKDDAAFRIKKLRKLRIERRLLAKKGDQDSIDKVDAKIYLIVNNWQSSKETRKKSSNNSPDYEVDHFSKQIDLIVHNMPEVWSKLVHKKYVLNKSVNEISRLYKTSPSQISRLFNQVYIVICTQLSIKM